MINPVSVIQMLGERHEFIKHHPELRPFITKIFENSIDAGTEIEICVKSPTGEKEHVLLNIEEADLPLLSKVQEILKQAK